MRAFFIKIISTIKTNKLFFRDAFLNTAAFMVYICSQQIILFPIMAKLLDSETYANMIMYITIMNVFCNALGGQLGVTHQLQKNSYGNNTKAENSDFMILMLGASLLIATCFPIIIGILEFDVISIFLSV